MSSGHRHSRAATDSKLADKYYAKVKPLLGKVKIDRTKTIPWLANRSKDGKTLYIDKELPRYLPKTKADTNLTLFWHELPEWAAMNDGMPYDKGEPSAHVDVATPLERREVERQGVNWGEYSREMDAYVKETDDEKMSDIPADIDKRPFTEDKDRKIIDELAKRKYRLFNDILKRARTFEEVRREIERDCGRT